MAVADFGNVSRAAEAGHLTQSAVSAQLRRLEAQLGCSVFERTTRSIRLTAQGELLLGYARSILTLHEQATLRLGATRRIAGTVRIGCSEGFVADWVFIAAGRFAAKYPDVNLQITLGITTELSEQVNRGAIDIVVGSRCQDSRLGELLWIEPLVWAFSEHASLDPGKPVPIALFPEPCPYREAALSALAHRGLTWRVVCTSPSVAGVQAAALAGFATTPLTRSAMTPGLVALPTGTFLPELPLAEFTMQLRPGKLDEPIVELASDIRQTCQYVSVERSRSLKSQEPV